MVRRAGVLHSRYPKKHVARALSFAAVSERRRHFHSRYRWRHAHTVPLFEARPGWTAGVRFRKAPLLRITGKQAGPFVSVADVPGAETIDRPGLKTEFRRLWRPCRRRVEPRLHNLRDAC
jgi:hypothetical protein